MENSHIFSMETHWIVSITAMSQSVCVLDWLLKVSVPETQNFWNIPATFDLLFPPKRKFSNEKIWCLETRLWLKVIFSHPGICKNICLIFACHRLIPFWQEKFKYVFLTTKFPFVQSRPVETHAQWTDCFCIWRREAVVV